MYIYVGEEAVAVEGMKNKMKRNLNNARDRVNYLCELTGCPCSSSNTSVYVAGISALKLSGKTWTSIQCTGWGRGRGLGTSATSNKQQQSSSDGRASAPPGYR